MSELFPITTASAAEMIEAGKRYGTGLRAGDVVALNGDLGAGKTHFCKGLVVGLDAREEVTSPTFSLVQEYLSGRVPIYHFDFYRLESVGELISLGWDDYLDEGGIILAEWADKFPEAFPDGTTWIDLVIEKDGRHTARLR
ncbi:MAG: tRNA (adenosine(37)-N6)-threonylcarbamoyltransferase complex ATPase subunit type 1 TsaE [Verrucomicrobiaceae bacterium]|nr:tRNA (adenosine(37)-N6)-threonylcarbamoyltransferase complex ATPase subunit type 1 TsaE [Verrucomicrobiaceae bacterium]